MKESFFKNGQKATSQKGDVLTYFYKSGHVKAKGKFVDDMMQGKWIFNHEDGSLWQIGHFKDNQKHGEWIRYEKSGKPDYHERFVAGKIIRK